MLSSCQAPDAELGITGTGTGTTAGKRSCRYECAPPVKAWQGETGKFEVATLTSVSSEDAQAMPGRVAALAGVTHSHTREQSRWQAAVHAREVERGRVKGSKARG